MLPECDHHLVLHCQCRSHSSDPVLGASDELISQIQECGLQQPKVLQGLLIIPNLHYYPIPPVRASSSAPEAAHHHLQLLDENHYQHGIISYVHQQTLLRAILIFLIVIPVIVELPEGLQVTIKSCNNCNIYENGPKLCVLHASVRDVKD